MSPRLSRREVIERVAAGLPVARWEYDEEADELEIVLPGGDARAGRAILIDWDVYLRLDVDTNEPLTIIIPAFSDWLGHTRLGPLLLPSDPPQSWQRTSYEAISQTLGQTVRFSNELAAAVP